ncbi:hypothetical protein [Streptomyces sp. NPDC017988]|uniref:hypothetical protein n=1 Tax=Streptomyces sp. NPDC017988 TaxID=3365025 RepID=UPI003789EE27
MSSAHTSSASRAEQAAQRIAALAEAAEPGARLGTKEALRALCSVSVGTFNESLRLLQARGQVTMRPGPGGGVFVAAQSPMARLGNSVLALDAQESDVAGRGTHQERPRPAPRRGRAVARLAR